MLPIFTSQEMQNIDQKAIQGDLDKGFKLMQKAARGLFDLVINKYLELQKQNKNSFINIFAGKGNNGGDGMLLAAYLAEEGYPVKCFIVGSATDIENEAKLAYLKLEKLNTKNQYIYFIKDTDDIGIIAAHLNQVVQKTKHMFMVDALLGLGIEGEAREPYASVIRLINEYQNNASIIAVDIPSGTNANNGEINSASVRAHSTVTMGFPKLGSFFYPARLAHGLTIVNSLDYADEIVKEEFSLNSFFVNSAKALIPPRIINGSKYDHGVLNLVAGASGMTGAAVLAGKAAYRSGLGLVNIVSNESKQISNHLLEAIYSNELDPRALVNAIGPGLGSQNYETIHKIVEENKQATILDADGINAFGNYKEILKNSSNEILITPHSAEYNRLFPDDIGQGISPEELIKKLQKRAQEYSMSILYKGAPTIIVDASGKTFIVPFGNSALATAGTGDVLTGMIAGFAAQIYSIKAKNPHIRFSYENFGISALSQAAILAAFIHGRAGETASQELGDHSVIASDLLNYIAPIIKNLP